MLRRIFFVAFTVAALCLFAASAFAQNSENIVFHRIDGRLRVGNAPASNIRVRLLREDQRRTIAETFSRSRGEFEFNFVPEGIYLVETNETPEMEATSTLVQVQPVVRQKTYIAHVDIDIPLRSTKPRVAPGVISADVDLHVPKDALKHYRAGMKALDESRAEQAVAEFREAVKIHPQYYAARFELGRELRLEKRFKEAEETLNPLREIAPKRAESWLEHGVVLLELGSREEAARELQTAVNLEEPNWAAHFYLGFALLETETDKAEPHLARALELNEKKAARAHLALARIADGRGQRAQAIQHLDAYLALSPDAADAAAARSLAERLRSQQK